VERFDLLVLGDANPDVVLRGAPDVLTYGQAEREVAAATLTLGGSGALMARAAAMLGLRTAFVGLVGDDEAAALSLGMLTAVGVDVSGVRRDPAVATAMTVVFVRPGGDRAILTSPGALADFGPEHVDLALLERAGHVHAASAFLQPRLATALPDLLGRARRASATTSLDTNDDPAGRWVLDRAAVLAEVDYLLPNEREAVALAYGAYGAYGAEADAGGDPLQAARLLAGLGPTVVVKRGAGGASAVDTVAGALREQHARLDAPGDLGDLADTVGAGDAFDAGFVAGLAQGHDLRGALRLAVAVGTLSTRGVGGASGQPTLAAAQRLAQHVVIDEQE
jgi:sugar/nucleoside kinase (ribokinase family)